MLVLKAELPPFVLESAPDEFLLSCTGAAGDAGATVAGEGGDGKLLLEFICFKSFFNCSISELFTPEDDGFDASGEAKSVVGLGTL
ncbi:hypothetical protein, partial [Acinetobacter sp. C_3_1]|uniref:hypothetical protein n=2 Tax=unclassified Acinetobacter TaxID=196816 RepID=UPI0021BB538D